MTARGGQLAPIDPARRVAFLLGRQAGLGGSDMPDLLGLTERNALDVYHVKTRPFREADADDEQTVDQLRGLLLEDMARALYWRHTGRRGRAVNGDTTHPDYPAFRCHLDFTIFEDPEREEALRGTGVGETKAPRSYVLQRILDDGPRQRELIQGQTYCAVARRDWCGFNYVSLEWSDGPTLAVDVVAQRELGQLLLETGQRFWEEHVVPCVPPDPDDFAIVGREVDELVRESSGELWTVRDAEALELFARYGEQYALERQAQATREELGDRLLAYIESSSPSDRVDARASASSRSSGAPGASRSRRPPWSFTGRSTATSCGRGSWSG